MIDINYKKIFSILAGNGFVVATNFIIAAVLVTKSGLENYGYFITVQSILLSIAIIFKPATWVSIVKYRFSASVFRMSVFSALFELLFAAICIVLMLIFSKFVSNKFLDFIFSNLTIVFFYITVVNSGVFLGVFRSFEMYKIVSIVLSVSAVIKLSLSFILYEDVDALLHGFIYSETLIWMVGVIYALNFAKASEVEAIKSLPDRKEFLKTSMISHVNQVLDLPLTQLDRVVVAFIAGNETAAIFNLVRRLSSLFNQLGEPLYQICLNQFSNSNFSFSSFSSYSMFVYSLKRIGVPVFLILCSYPFIMPYLDYALFDSSLQQYYLLLFEFLLITALSITFIWINPLYFLHVSQYNSMIITFIANLAYVTSLVVVFKILNVYFSFLCLLLQLVVNYSIKFYEIRRAKRCFR